MFDNIFKNKKNNAGFSLIELLVFVAIVGLLATLSIASLESARQKARDVKRTADIRQFMTVLDIYFNDFNTYPVEQTLIVLGDVNHSCFDEDGFVAICDDGGKIYIGNVPSNPTPKGSDYTYKSTNGDTYELTFMLERGVGDITEGYHLVTPEGFN